MVSEDSTRFATGSQGLIGPKRCLGEATSQSQTFSDLKVVREQVTRQQQYLSSVCADPVLYSVPPGPPGSPSSLLGVQTRALGRRPLAGPAVVVLPAGEAFVLGRLAVGPVPHLGEGVGAAVGCGSPASLRPQGVHLGGLADGGSLQADRDALGRPTHQRDGLGVRSHGSHHWELKDLVFVCGRITGAGRMR